MRSVIDHSTIERRQVGRGDLTLAKVLRSELIKFRSLRSLIWLTVAGAVMHAALGPIQALGAVVAEEQADEVTSLDAALALALTGMGSACIIFGILGILTVSSEYPRKAIRGTFTATPRRWLVVTAKQLAYVVVSAVAAVLSSVVALALSIPSLKATGFSVDVLDPEVARVLLAASLYLVVWGVYGQLLAWLLRSTTGATMALLAAFFVVPSLFGLLPRGAAEVLYPLLPSEAAAAMLGLGSNAMAVAPAAGFGLTVAYVLAGVVLVTRWVDGRDA